MIVGGGGGGGERGREREIKNLERKVQTSCVYRGRINIIDSYVLV